MEKYRQFGDATTGVHPFVPLWSQHRSPLPLRLLKLLLFPIALLRMFFFGIGLMWLGVAEALYVVIPIGVVRFPIYRAVSYVGCTIALATLGIVSTRAEIADHRRLKLSPPKTSGARVFNASRGAVIFVNHQGITDVLILGLKLCPIFVFPASDGTPVQFSLLGALRRAASCKEEVAPPNSVASLAEIAAKAKSSWQTVVVFPEGTRTIGNAVLPWDDRTLEGLESLNSGIALMSIQYTKTGAYTPHHTVGTALSHIFWLSNQLGPHTAKSVWLPSRDVTTALKGKSMDEQTALLRTLLTRMIQGAVEVDVGADTHLEFMSFWEDAQRKGYTQKKNKNK